MLTQPASGGLRVSSTIKATAEARARTKATMASCRQRAPLAWEEAERKL